MKKTAAAALAGMLSLTAGCGNWLDVNTNPNAPQTVSANLYIPPMEHWMVTAPQYDGRFVGRYTQEWMLATTSTLSTWDRMGYDPASDNGGEQWRDVYWSLGQNLVDMMNKARAEQRWDVLGVGYVMKAWGYQMLTDMHGAIIIKEFPDPTRTTFDYDPQQYAYQTVRALLDSAITSLKRTDGAVDATYLAQGDHIYNGDRTKWLKLAYAIYAMNLNHYSNKPSYNPDSVIALVNQSFQSNADDALLLYPGQTSNDDLNFYGPTRGNIGIYRQTKFAVGLMNGTVFGVPDPRLTRILAPAPDGVWRGVDPNIPFYGGLPASQRPNNLWGYPGTVGQEPGRYLFTDKVRFPLNTYAQLQFVKAEAAYRKGDLTTALTAYKNGISASIDFVNARIAEDNQSSETQISATEKATFLASPTIVPAASNLTLTQIMSQKYIAQYGWGHDEMWTDMRRYHYTDLDPKSGVQVFPGFSIPQTLYVDNAGKPAYLIRPRYNSEYVWNQAGLSAIGALAPDYHTTIPWIFTNQP